MSLRSWFHSPIGGSTVIVCIVIILASFLSSHRLLLVSGNGEFNNIKDYFEGLKEEMITFRRDLHQHPELKFEEYRTAEKVKKKLQEYGISYIEGLGARREVDFPGQDLPYIPFPYADGKGTGIIADIGTGSEPCIGLRADMDALPIKEDVNIEYISQFDGKMHACGHDAHTTMLLFAAKYLKSIEHKLRGTVRIIFQPGEELGGAGAYMMEKEGVLTKHPPVERIFGLHVHNGLPTGKFALTKGPALAGGEGYQVFIKGKGGHVARQRLAVNPIPAAAAIASALTEVVSQETSFLLEETGIMTVSAIRSGNTHNVIPSEAHMMGTMRAYSVEMQKRLRNRLHTIVNSISEAYRCTAEIITASFPYIVVHNNENLYEELMEVAKEEDIEILPGEAFLGSEDFGFFTARVPGLFAMLGVGSGTVDKDGVAISSKTSPHSPQFAIDENALPYGSTLHAFYAINSLNKLNPVRALNDEL